MGSLKEKMLEYTSLYDTGDPFAHLDFNKFWYEWLQENYQDEGMIGEGDYGVNFPLDGGELTLTITGSGNAAAGGAMLLKELNSDHFPEGADITSFAVVVDARNLDVGEGGYGVLLRGEVIQARDKDGEILENQYNDYGYMFQFDPGARGFVIRRIKRRLS